MGPGGLSIGRALSVTSDLGSGSEDAAEGVLPADVLDQRLPQLSRLKFSRVTPNRVCCNALLAAYARAKPPQWEKALRLLAAIEESRGKVAPDTVSYNTVLKVCGKAQRINQAMKVYGQMVTRGVKPSITTFSTLITAASDSGDFQATKQAWTWLQDWGLEVNAACLNSYMAALVKLGQWDEARSVLRASLSPSSRCKPSVVTVNTVMAARPCGHCNCVSTGRRSLPGLGDGWATTYSSHLQHSRRLPLLSRVLVQSHYFADPHASARWFRAKHCRIQFCSRCPGGGCRMCFFRRAPTNPVTWDGPI
eukprot:jgi/Botrbrau1/9677/Bobra.0201s0011.1